MKAVFQSATMSLVLLAGLMAFAPQDRVGAQTPGSHGSYSAVEEFSDASDSSENRTLARQYYVYYKGSRDRAWIYDNSYDDEVYAQQRVAYLQARSYQARYVAVGR